VVDVWICNSSPLIAPVYKALRDTGLFMSPLLLKAVLVQFGKDIE
jgi:hypothetical protein